MSWCNLKEQTILSLQEQLKSLSAPSSKLCHHKQPDLHRHQTIKAPLPLTHREATTSMPSKTSGDQMGNLLMRKGIPWRQVSKIRRPQRGQHTPAAHVRSAWSHTHTHTHVDLWLQQERDVRVCGPAHRAAQTFPSTTSNAEAPMTPTAAQSTVDLGEIKNFSVL